MKTIILIQHTESEHHVNHHIGAQYEWNLTVRGREQAFRIGKWLKREGCDQTWSMFVSPQIRARQTAEEINRSLGISPVIREELREVNAGMGNDKTREWYRTNAAPRGAVFDPDHRDFPDAESDRELWNRVLPFFRDMIASSVDRVIVVSHGTTISFLQSMMAGQSVEDRGRFRFNGSSQDIVRAYDIGPNRFHREKLTGGHLLQSGSVENIIRAGNRTPATLQAAHIADVEFDFVCDVGVSGLVFVPHVVLFLLVTGEDADFFDIRCKETLEHSIPERTGTTGDHQGFVFENRHGNLS